LGSATWQRGSAACPPTLRCVSGVLGSAASPSPVSGNSSRASRSSCTESTKAAPSGLHSAGGTAVACAKQHSRTSAQRAWEAISWAAGCACWCRKCCEARGLRAGDGPGWVQLPPRSWERLDLARRWTGWGWGWGWGLVRLSKCRLEGGGRGGGLPHCAASGRGASVASQRVRG
jgi:hypothetical protein